MQSGVTGDFGEGGAIRCDNGDAPRHGLDDGDAEPFVERGEGEERCPAVEGLERLAGDIAGDFDVGGAGAALDERGDVRGTETDGAGEDEFPTGTGLLKGFDEAGGVLTFLDGPDAEDDRFARLLLGKFGGSMDAVVDDAELVFGDVEERFDLGGGKGGDAEDEIGTEGGGAGLGGEALAEIGRGVVAGHDEEVMKRGDAAARVGGGDALIQAVEEIVRREPGISEGTAGRAGGEFIGERLEEFIGAVAEGVAGLRAAMREAMEDFAGVDADTGECGTETVSGVESNAHRPILARRRIGRAGRGGDRRATRRYRPGKFRGRRIPGAG